MKKLLTSIVGLGILLTGCVTNSNTTPTTSNVQNTNGISQTNTIQSNGTSMQTNNGVNTTSRAS